MRLYRPYIPLEARCRVVLRQLGELWPDAVIALWKPKPGPYLKGIGVFVPRRGLAALLASKLDALAVLLDCKIEDLRLDHDPALVTRLRTGEGKRTIYSPDANSPDYLIYREKHAHHIKTNVRGDGAQFPDRVLIKRERKRQKKAKKVPVKRHVANRVKNKAWPSRPLRSVSRWPARGTRKISRRNAT